MHLTKDPLVIDFETTGLYPEIDWPIQLGVVRLDKETLETKAEFVSDIMPLDPVLARNVDGTFAYTINHIGPERLEAAPFPDEVLYFLEQEIFSPTERSRPSDHIILVAQNLQFDYGFMRRFLRSAGAHQDRYGFRGLDLSTLAWMIQAMGWVNFNGHLGLPNQAAVLGLDCPDTHDGLDDARTAAEVFKRYHSILQHT